MAGAERRTRPRLFTAAWVAGALLGACSLQDFEYLQEGSAGSSATGGAVLGGSGGLEAGSGGVGEGGTTSGGGSGGSGGAGGSGNTGPGGSGGTDSGGSGGSGGASGGMAGAGAEGTGGAAGAGGSGGMTGPDTLQNPSWETGVSHTSMPGWENSGDVDAAYVDFMTARTGSGRLGHWHDTLAGYSVSTYQKVSPIPNGTYTFRLWVMRDVNWTEQYIFARGFSAEDPTLELRQPTDAAPSNAYAEVVLSGIVVTNGECEVGVHSVAPYSGVWANMDDAEFVMEEEPPDDPPPDDPPPEDPSE